MRKTQIDKIVKSVQENFRTFGGGQDVSQSNNPICHALKNKPPQFAAGVDVQGVVEHILKSAKKLQNR